MRCLYARDFLILVLVETRISTGLEGQQVTLILCYLTAWLQLLTVS